MTTADRASQGQRVYIAGPISLGGTIDAEAVERNRSRFWEAEAWLRERGYEPLNPVVHPVIDGKPWVDYMRLGLAMVLEAEAILMLPGWQQSRGACLERHVAEGLGLEIWEFSLAISWRYH